MPMGDIPRQAPMWNWFFPSHLLIQGLPATRQRPAEKNFCSYELTGSQETMKSHISLCSRLDGAPAPKKHRWVRWVSCPIRRLLIGPFQQSSEMGEDYRV